MIAPELEDDRCQLERLGRDSLLFVMLIRHRLSLVTTYALGRAMSFGEPVVIQKMMTETRGIPYVGAFDPIDMKFTPR